MVQTLSMGVATLAVWLLWSGIYQPLIVGLGVASCIGAVLISRAMGILDEEGAPVHLSLGLLTYVPWLTWAIIKSNIDIALCILRPSLPISPRLVHVKPGQKTDLGRVVYANSITLTPGTVTCDADGAEFVVHALTSAAADDLVSGDMNQRVMRLEGTS